MAGLERVAKLANLVGEPGNAERRMAEHAGGETRLLDFGILVHDAADPAQVDIQRTDRTAAERDAGGGAVVGHRVDDLARIGEPRINDLDRRDHIFGGAQHVGEADARPFKPLAHDEGQFDLDARLAEIRVQNLGAVANHLVVEDVAIIRLVDHRGTLHRLGGQADLVADQLGAGGDLAARDLGRDRIRVLDRDGRECLRERRGLLVLLLGIFQNIGALFTIGFGQHRRSPLFILL